MSLDVYLTAVRPTEVYSANITHNLSKMAREAGLYELLWRPEEIPAKIALELIEGLETGLQELESDPAHYRQFDADNGWGVYENLVNFVKSYLKACKDNPDAEIRVWR